MRVFYGFFLIFTIVLLTNCKPKHERREHRDPHALKAGLRNQGNTCFANAVTNLVLSSSLMLELLKKPLPDLPTQPDALGENQEMYDLREKFRQSLLELHEAREGGEKNLDVEINKYFDAYEAAALKVNGSKLVGGEVGGAHLRCDQGDALALIQDLLLFLGYLSKEHIQFTYNKFADNSIKVFKAPSEPVVLLDVKKSANNKAVSIQSLYEDWSKPELMDGVNQVKNSHDVLMDSERYQALVNPPPSSLIFVLRRFDRSSGVLKRLFDPVVVNKKLDIKAFDKKNIKKSEDYKYKLSSIVVQRGVLSGGHYYAYVFDADNNRWIKYDDSSVSLVSWEEVQEDALTNGYLFLYQR
jgi:hypothetical protein